MGGEVDMGSLTFDGTTGNYASTPDAAALDITGDLDLMIRLSMPDWTPASAAYIFGKWSNSVAARAFTLLYNPAGNVTLQWYDSSNASQSQSSSELYSGVFTAGEPGWIRATMDVDNGSSDADILFYYSLDNTNDPDAVSWTQLGLLRNEGNTTDIRNGAARLTVGARDGDGASAMTGNVYRAVAKNGIGGTVVFDADFTDLTAGEIAAGSFVEGSSNAATVTLNGSAWTATPGVSAAATLHGDQLFRWIQENYAGSFTSLELVGALNELNGTNGVEYAQARGTFLGVDPAG